MCDYRCLIKRFENGKWGSFNFGYLENMIIFIFLIQEKKLRYLRLIFGITFLTLGFPSPKQFCDFQYGCLVEYTI